MACGLRGFCNSLTDTSRLQRWHGGFELPEELHK